MHSIPARTPHGWKLVVPRIADTNPILAWLRAMDGLRQALAA
jgi:hypothetical protein